MKIPQQVRTSDDVFDVQYHRDEAMKNFIAYHGVNERIAAIEAAALKAAGKNARAQNHLLSADTLEAFIYQQLCKNRATFITLTNMHTGLAMMLK